jgi:hypothetical protein
MALQDGCKAIPELKALDPHTEQIVVVFNARCATPEYTVPLTSADQTRSQILTDLGRARIPGLMPPIWC